MQTLNLFFAEIKQPSKDSVHVKNHQVWHGQDQSLKNWTHVVATNITSFLLPQTMAAVRAVATVPMIHRSWNVVTISNPL